jgi:hypothetical protein
MKKAVLLVLLFFSVSLFAQNEIKITSKKCIPRKGFHLKLLRVFDDSRCPENVTCIWAGEVSALVEVYNNKKFVEEKTITFNSKNTEENIVWFSKYYQNKIKSVDVVPYPKQEVVVKAKNQYIAIRF